MRLPGIGAHHSALRQSDEWYTPRHITEALGPFDLDPCSPPGGWVIEATRYYTQEDDGLTAPWEGLVWVNPPYSEADKWLERLADHGNGFALVFARTETRWWHTSIWQQATAILFLEGRLAFVEGASRRSMTHNAGGPSAVIAYGNDAAGRLHLQTSIQGALVTEWR